MPTVAACCGGPSPLTWPLTILTTWTKAAQEGARGAATTSPHPPLCSFSALQWKGGVRKCCSPSLICAWCLTCIRTTLAAPGFLAPAPHLEPLAEDGKASGGLQGSKVCGQQPIVPAWRTHHPKVFCTPANAFEWEPASSPEASSLLDIRTWAPHI